MTDPTPCLCWYSTTLSCYYEGAEGGTDPYSQHWNNQEVPIPMEKIEKFPVVRCFTIPIRFNFSFPNSTPRIQSHFPKLIKKQVSVPNLPFLLIYLQYIECSSMYQVLHPNGSFVKNLPSLWSLFLRLIQNIFHNLQRIRILLALCQSDTSFHPYRKSPHFKNKQWIIKRLIKPGLISHFRR